MPNALLPTSFQQFLQQGCGRCSLTNTPQCKVHSWQSQLIALQNILAQTPLQETIKWGFPCYSFAQKNILLLGVFNQYVTVSFFKGVYLTDDQKMLVQQGQNTQEARILKITLHTHIPSLEKQLLQWVSQAIELEKLPPIKSNSAPKTEPIPQELEQLLETNTALKKAFYLLTPGKKRGYLLHFNGTKNSDTRTTRIHKCIEKIMAGKAFQDK
jgi:uncharacterized protein YdeI (YjbR/CyaY-like superfamily)